jgi:hypothetical protein
MVEEHGKREKRFLFQQQSRYGHAITSPPAKTDTANIALENLKWSKLD